MPEYRIRKQGREFTATQLDTLEELASRGLLAVDDPVSVDGGEWLPAGEVSELVEILDRVRPVTSPGDDPWRHFDDENVRDVPGDDDMLASFLDRVSSGRSSSPAEPPPSPPASPPPSHIGRLERTPELSGFPGGLGAVLGPRPVRGQAEEVLPMIEPEPLDDDDDESDDQLTAVSSDGGSAVVTEPAGEASEEGAPAAEMPVSFTEWLENHDSGEGKPVLEGFGRYDDGIFVPKPPDMDLVNPIRVVLIVLFAGALIGSWYIWVKTVAETAYPLESELAEGLKPPPPAGGVGRRMDDVDRGPSVPQVAEGEYELRLRTIRQDLTGQIREFHTPAQLEDALFQEFINRSVAARRVEVVSLQERGTQDFDERRPTQANLSIELSGVSSDGEEGMKELEDQLMLVWLLVGKYSDQGRVRFEEVEVKVSGALPLRERYEGRRLNGLWGRQVTAESLFAGER